MANILVTGSGGFIGKHLVEALAHRKNVRVIGYDLENTQSELHKGLAEADFIFHLAGVNRPQRPEDFKAGNADFTANICDSLAAIGRSPTIILSSSIQAELNNPYGLSKRQAEESLRRWAEAGLQQTAVARYMREAESHAEPVTRARAPAIVRPQVSDCRARRAIIFRLKNVFGKWCRPNYNSVTATFCQNIAHDLPITISDPGKELELVYIDDVMAAFIRVLDGPPPPAPCTYAEVSPTFKVTLGELAAKISSFRDSRKTAVMPSFADGLTRRLYATYLSYLAGADFAYSLAVKTDKRGCLAEFMKSEQFGQIFVSRTKPGSTRGNHYHHTKTEKFFVVEGEAIVRFRHTAGSEIIQYRISSRDFKVLDIPPGFTHSIENVGDTELVVLFWASEIFDPQRPDTYGMEVKP